MDINGCSFLRSTYNPTTVADASRWMMLCKLIIGQHPGRIVITKKSYSPIIAVHWSMVGLAFSIIYIAYAVIGVVVMLCINLPEIRSLSVNDTDLSRVQSIVVHGLNNFSMYVLFIRLFWHRNHVRDRISLMVDMERQFSEVGIPVKLQRRRTYVRSVLWSFGFVMFNLFFLSYSFYVAVGFSFKIFVVVVAMLIMPTLYRQSLVLFYMYDLAETKRFFIQLNEILREVLQAERGRADTSLISFLE